MLLKQTVPQSGWDKFKAVVINEIFGDATDAGRSAVVLGGDNSARTSQAYVVRIQGLESKRTRIGCELIGRI
ncbi:MAG: hypothetical protein AAGD96_24455 [Chloroflexota bacterium]